MKDFKSRVTKLQDLELLSEKLHFSRLLIVSRLKFSVLKIHAVPLLKNLGT